MVQRVKQLLKVQLPTWRANHDFSSPPCKSLSRKDSIHKRYIFNSANNPEFSSVVDNPPSLVRTGRRHGPGLIVLGSTLNLFWLRDEPDVD